MNRDSAAALRARLDAGGIVVAPGVPNPIAALLAERAGFEALYVSGGALANSLGLADTGLTTLTELHDHVVTIRAVTERPLIVDCDTGFGDVASVRRTIDVMERAGVAAVHLEDQVMPKRCGHLDGKEVVAAAEMVARLAAARQARSGQLLLIARTDARAVEGFEAAVQRGLRYLEAGADAIFPEALLDADEFAEYARRVPAPLLANMTEFGKGPMLTAQELEGLGYRIVIFPQSAFRAMLGALRDAYAALKRAGTQAGLVGAMLTRAEINDLIGYEPLRAADRSALAAAERIARGGT